MGFRTVVVLYNDNAHVWGNDPRLGAKIQEAALKVTTSYDPFVGEMGYGRVVECAHADMQTLGIFDSYHFRPLAFSNWVRNQSNDEVSEKLLRDAADQLGYRLVKKPKRKPKTIF